MLGLWKCKPCSALDFKCAGYKMAMDEENKFEQVTFLPIRHVFKAEMEKASSES